MTGYKISDIATAMSAEFVGDGDLTITGAREPGDAGAEHLAVAMAEKYADSLAAGDARAAILWQGADWRAFGLEAAIFVKRPRLAMAALTRHIDPSRRPAAGIHDTAIIDPSASIGEGSSIGPYVVIGADVKIAAGACIGAHTTIGYSVSIGKDARLDAGVRIGNDVSIGDRFFACSGVVIGADGFSFVTEEISTAETLGADAGGAQAGLAGQKWHKIRSLGGVRIGDDVEIGANSSVDAGTIRPTLIGDGTKIDTLVQVGHNVQVGKNCLLCAQVGVAGSAIIGDGAVLAGQVGVVDNVTVGEGVVAAAASKILGNVPPNQVILGYPAIKIDRHMASYKALRRLPRILQNMANSKKAVSKEPGTD